MYTVYQVIKWGAFDTLLKRRELGSSLHSSLRACSLALQVTAPPVEVDEGCARARPCVRQNLPGTRGADLWRWERPEPQDGVSACAGRRREEEGRLMAIFTVRTVGSFQDPEDQENHLWSTELAFPTLGRWSSASGGSK